MRIVVIGGTGRLGGALVARALAVGHTPVVFGRSVKGVPAGAIAVAGDATDAAALDAAIAGADAVIVALSIPRASPSPFAAVTGPPDLHSRSAAGILAAMARHGVRRIVKVSAQGVGDSAPRAGWGFRALVAVSNLGPAFADHAVADALVRASDRDWTILHPPVLAEGGGGGAVRAGEDVTTGTFTRLPRGDLARWLVDGVGDPSWVRRTVTVAPGAGS